jgi:hypothetical protein
VKSVNIKANLLDINKEVEINKDKRNKNSKKVRRNEGKSNAVEYRKK